jgi:hypothetical protein
VNLLHHFPLKIIFITLFITACTPALKKENQALKKENQRLELEVQATKKTVDSLLGIKKLVNSFAGYTFDNFHITEKRVGIFSKGITVADLYLLLPKEQIKKTVGYGEFADDTYDEYQIYDSNGKQLLVLSAEINDNPAAKIDGITIIDPRFKTTENIGLNTPYGVLQKTYSIDDIFQEEGTIYLYSKWATTWFFFGINTADLPEITVDNNGTLEIPEDAKVDIFGVHWEIN